MKKLDGEIQSEFTVPCYDLRVIHTSRTLKELKEKDLVTILNPEAKKSRFYQLTPKAKG